VHLTDGRSIAGDLFIDCTGFRRLLVGERLGGDWVSYRRHLLCDTAIPFMLPHETDGEIDPFTEATALSAGWMWRIPTGDRIGCGYAFSSAFSDPESAQREVEAHLGRPIDPVRTISFDPGRLADSWIGNTVALGLASNFTEPLEATSIHCTLLQMHLLAGVLTPTLDLAADVVRDQYNRQVAQILDEVRDFLVIHYLSDRRDTAFWRHLKHTDFLPDRLRRQIELWRHKPIEDLDFDSYNRFPTFGALPYMYVLNGLGRLDRELAQRSLDRWELSERARRTASLRAETIAQLLPHAVSHGELIHLLNS
jgi:tryptophan halogenase